MARRRYYPPISPGTIVQFRLEGMDTILATMKSLPAELVSKRGGPIRYALHKAGKIMHTEAVRLAPIRTGNLKASIVMRRGTEVETGPGYEKQFIFVRRGTSNRRSAYYAGFQEFGTSRNKATPFMRPAFHSTGGEVLEEFSLTLRRAVGRLAKRYQRMMTRA